MTRVVQSPAAELDLEDIWLAIAADNPTAATEKICAPSARGSAGWPIIPGSARAAPTFGRRCECWSRGRHIIFYETHPDTDEGPVDRVEVIRVVDGRRDLSNLL